MLNINNNNVIINKDSDGDNYDAVNGSLTIQNYAIVGIKEQYSKTMIIDSLKAQLPYLQILEFPCAVNDTSKNLILYWLEYEDLDFNQIINNKSTQLANSYCIRKVNL